MSFVNKVRATLRVGGTTMSYLTYKAMTRPQEARAFFRDVADAVTEFPTRSRKQLRTPTLPSVSLDHICPDISSVQLTIRPHIPRAHELTEAEYLTMAALIAYYRPHAIFEIGTNRGRTTRLMAEGAPASAKVYTLDLPPERMNESGCFPEANGALIGEAFRDAPCRTKITQLYGDSRTFDFRPFARTMDFIFIDGDHS